MLIRKPESMNPNIVPHNPDSHPGRFTAAALAVAAGAVVLAGCSSSPNQTTPHPGPTSEIIGAANLLDGQWGYMPGDVVTHDGLTIESHDFKIVEQDGSDGQPNPPVNEYGTRLTVRGGFEVSTELKNIQGPASIRLYATPPEVSDEFRVEPKSVAATVNGHALTVNLWNGNGAQDLAHQQPVETERYQIPGNDTDVQLGIDYEGEKIAFTVNGSTVGSIAGQQIFANSGQAWLGFNSAGLHNDFDVSKLTTRALAGGQVTVVNTAAEAPVPKSPESLQELVNKVRPGFLIGTDIATWAATSSESYDEAAFNGNFGIVTPENAMKWEFTEPEPGVFDFHEADAIVAMAKKNDMQVHGHNLVFGEALPEWVRDLPTNTPEQKDYVKKVLYDHVYALASHFKGQVDEWDINEPFAYYDDNGSIPNDGFVNSVFYRALGSDYVKVVANAARAANPDARLWINDYGAENDTDAYWKLIYTTLKEWKEQGVPIYGFGFESHIYTPKDDDIANDPDGHGGNVLNDHINQLGAIGLFSRVSEFDAPQNDPTYAQDHSSQIQQFTGTLKICLTNPHCIAFSTWSTGVTDIYQSAAHQLLRGVDSMFNQANQSLPAYNAVKKKLQKAA
jgi:endo-1,4-beta-xylanase